MFVIIHGVNLCTQKAIYVMEVTKSILELLGICPEETGYRVVDNFALSVFVYEV